MKIRHKLAVTTLSLSIIIIGMFFVTWWVTGEQKDVGLVINLAGRQRMLSQKMSKEILNYHLTREQAGQENPTLAGGVKNTMKIFDITLAALKDSGEAPLSLDLKTTAYRTCPRANEPAYSQLEKVSKMWQSFSRHIEDVLEKPDQAEESLAWILKNNVPLLQAMDKAVGMMQQQSEKKVGQLLGAQGVGILIGISSMIFAILTILSIVKRLDSISDSAESLRTGDLTNRFVEDAKTPCVKLLNCENRDCPSHTDNPGYQKGPCWGVAGSNAPVVQCPKILKGKAGGGLDTCEACEVFQETALDEIGVTARGLNTFVTKLQGMLKEIHTDSANLATSSVGLRTISEQMSSDAGQTSERSNTVAAASEEMSSNMASVAAATEEASTNVGMVASASEQMTSTINEVAQNTEKARAITGEAVSDAKNASEKVDELGEAAIDIGKVTETITEISEQTNLLALNATIEAARAGEAGKGFAVVANEIKELARQTAEATGEIKIKIEGIQNSTQGTVEQIDQISKVINQVNEIVSAIATAVEEQSVTTKEIANNVFQASQGIQEVTENISQVSNVSVEVAKDVADVNQSANEMSNSSSQVSLNAEELSTLAEKLQEMVGRFTL